MVLLTAAPVFLLCDSEPTFRCRGTSLSTQAQIRQSYDVSNDFYRLFLDERMIYSCALFAGDEGLERAQLNKLEWIASAARVEPGARVLDIGCGWGGNLAFLVEQRRAREAVGITLSPAQYEAASTLGVAGASAQLVSYREFAPAEPFEAIVSIGMFEHIATPEEARSGRHIELYRDYFRRAWEWSTPGAGFGLQTVIGLRIPRDRQALRDMGEVTYGIFPGAISPRLEAVIASVNPYWEVVEVQTRRTHYARTLEHWHARLRGNEAAIRAGWGAARFAEYDRYLSATARAFYDGYVSLAQLALRRVDLR
jgi:cyclopropane-fatty-acyl-phospholipid synthase